MNLFKALFGSSFFQQEMKRNQQYRDNYACCDDIDVNIDLETKQASSIQEQEKTSPMVRKHRQKQWKHG